MTNRYIMHFNPSQMIGPIGPQWTVLNCVQSRDAFPLKGSQFQGCSVVLIHFSREEIHLVLASARMLMAVAGEVKIFKALNAEAINEQVLLNAPPVPNTVLDMDEDDYAALADTRSFQPIHPAQDYDNGTMFYGAVLHGRDGVVTSDFEHIYLATAQMRDISLLQNQLSIANLRPVTIIEHISGGDVVAPDAVFCAIREYIHRHIYFQDAETYDLVALWIMGTYIFRVFRYYPYLHLNAEKGSGKTLLMELMSPVSFNGILLSQPAASTVIKLIDQSSATLFIDEAESLSSGNHQILKTGFARSGIFYAGEKMYRTYSPKCFAGINEIDDVLADRAITIKMMRKTGTECVGLYRETAEMRHQQMLMRDSLYLFGLRFGVAIAKEYEMGGPIAHLSNRAYDIWAPLYRIVSAFEEGNLKMQALASLDKLSEQDNTRRKIRDSEENETGMLIQGLTDVLRGVMPILEDGGSRYYDPDKLFAEMVRQEKIPSRIKRKGFSRLIKRILDIDSVPKAFEGSTKRMYAVDMVKFNEYKNRYGDPEK